MDELTAQVATLKEQVKHLQDTMKRARRDTFIVFILAALALLPDVCAAQRERQTINRGVR